MRWEGARSRECEVTCLSIYTCRFLNDQMLPSVFSQIVFDFHCTYLIKEVSTKCGQKMIPSGITKGQDFFLDCVTFWIKFFHFFDCIIHFGVIIMVKAHLNNVNKNK